MEEETKKKISNSLKKFNKLRYGSGGRKHTDESREKMKNNKNALGSTRSKETREKISNGLRNHPCYKSEQRSKKLSESKKGKFGKKSNNWQGGKTRINLLVRSSSAYKQWRSNVFERDEWTCKTCNSIGGRLEAHHKKKFSDILRKNKIRSIKQALLCEELWDMDNGVTLCVDCHRLTGKGQVS